ncbi:MAG: universal stress protein [Bacteroidota bacterium]
MYKKILVPTDFSRPALAAGDLAIEMAHLFNAEVHFFHKLALPPKWDVFSEAEKARFPEVGKRLKYMQNNFEVLRKRYKGTHVKLSTTYSGGDMVPTISRYIKEEEVYMIVMGSHGASGLKEFVFGSNAQKVVRHANCPVLVVKQPIEKVDFKNVVFASDFREEAKAPFAKFLEFARRYNAHVHLLHIAAYPRFEASPEDIERMKSFAESCPLPHTIHGVGDLEVGDGIEFFAKKYKADLVSLAHYGGGPLKRVIKGSVSESMVNHLDLPVLILNTETETYIAPENDSDDASADPIWNFATL